MIKRYFDLLTVFVLPVLLLGLTGCAINEGAMQRLTPTPKAVHQVELALAPQSALPDFAQEAEPRIRDAYRFAVANPDVMTKIPCYCGCGTMGHENALDCFVKDVQPNGSIEFDNHAAGCGICVDITQDVMRLMRQDQPLKSIRAYVDAEYSQFAAPTNTPAIE